MEDELPVSYRESIADPETLSRFRENNRRMAESRGLSEQQHWASVIDAIEAITGPLHTWQRVYAIAAISGRGMEWTQARGSSHYHIVGLSCPVCGRR